jgi:ABC-type glycerol-3-phosphate transport system substrate-binding protein
MHLRSLAVAAACAVAFGSPALAETNVTILHVNEIAAAKTLWDKIAADYNAAHPGVKVQFQYLENEAFKAKLPTMLQSEDSRPSLFYSWGGGLMDAQYKAGSLKDITKDVASWETALSPTAVDAFKVEGKVVGVPFEVGEVVLWYNKKLFEKAGVQPEGAEASIKDPLMKRIADDLAVTTYHQNYPNIDLGPAVGRVFDDVSVAVAEREMTPEAGAAAIQDAAEQQ